MHVISFKMASFDLVIRNFLTGSSVVYFVILLAILYVVKIFFYNHVYAYVMNLISKKMKNSKYFNAVKKNLFEQLRPGDKIVDIGAGSGANFEYYPEECEVTCVEPKSEFKSYVTESIKEKGAHLRTVKMKTGVGEKLSDLFEADSVDAVVSTLVLCSVQSVEDVAREVKHILKPGGKFYFMEHVKAGKDHRLVPMIQDNITKLSVHLCDNCHWNREPWKQIEAVGFSQVEYQRKITPKTTIFSPMRWLCVGTATK